MSRLPLLLSIPHGGSMLPREYAPRFALSAAELFHESDPWTREIFAMGEAVQGRIEAEVAKAVVDLNCDPGLVPPKVPSGAIKQVTAFGRPIWTDDGFPTSEEMDRLLDRYHRPYHDVLNRTSNRGGVRLAIDCHSLYAYGPPGAPDAEQARPLFVLGNLGDEKGEGKEATAPAPLLMLVAELLEKEFADLEPLPGTVKVAINAPVVSNYTLRRHGKGRTPWLQLSLNRSVYLKNPADVTNVPDSDREGISNLRRRLFSVMCDLSDRIDEFIK
ncbi:N-formylglutamate amidohydrolase [bacterium]|nr:N-formylglutamate amidohydrolase [bacterium]